MARLRRGVTLDTGALIALERGDQHVRELVARWMSRGPRMTVPAVVVAEAWRGARQHALIRVLTGVMVEAVDEEMARRAGELLARTGRGDTVDAIVAVSAARRGDMVVTSDPDDMLRFADDLPSISVWSL